MDKIRVRFAPSPTGALHIGGVRTALYNYLLARKMGGTFILRIEDTDHLRYVEGAEEYIIEALNWCGLNPDEGPGIGGDYGPYRQSERKEIYAQYARQLVKAGHAYYAFDTPEELEIKRKEEKEKNNHTFKYDASIRKEMKNSITLPEEEVKELLGSGAPFTIRLKVPGEELIKIKDLVRGEVVFQSNELDDKVILKGDGMPTYHLANVVDDHLMKITHVIRGEEWLPSTAHHMLLYKFLGWEDTVPQFAHLPLILKPSGKGKLSKRDGSRLGIPVFPLSWNGQSSEDSFTGFREYGFDPGAVVNFLAFLGWNPGTEEEIFSLNQLCDAFSIERIGKSGARFDFEKAKWFNQHYIMTSDSAALARQIRPLLEEKKWECENYYLEKFCELMKERVSVFPEFLEKGYYFFEPVKAYDEKTIGKKWKPELQSHFQLLAAQLEKSGFEAEELESVVKGFIKENALKFGDILPPLRIAISGTMQGPSVFEILALLGKEESLGRIRKALVHFDQIISLKK